MKKRILCLLAFSSLLFSCSSYEESSNDYNYYEEKHSLSSLDDFYSVENDKYFIYLYSDACSFCTFIEGKVLSYFDYQENEDNSIPNLYFYNMKSKSTVEGLNNRAKFKQYGEGEVIASQLIEEMYQNCPSTISETYFIATPSLYVIENNKFSEYYQGSSDVPSFLYSVMNSKKESAIYSTILLVSLTLLVIIGSIVIYKTNKKKA